MIIQLDEALVRLRGELSDNAQELGRTLNIEKLRQDAAETEALTTAPDFWSKKQCSPPLPAKEVRGSPGGNSSGCAPKQNRPQGGSTTSQNKNAGYPYACSR